MQKDILIEWFPLTKFFDDLKQNCVTVVFWKSYKTEIATGEDNEIAVIQALFWTILKEPRVNSFWDTL